MPLNIFSPLRLPLQMVSHRLSQLPTDPGPQPSKTAPNSVHREWQRRKEEYDRELASLQKQHPKLLRGALDLKAALERVLNRRSLQGSTLCYKVCEWPAYVQGVCTDHVGLRTALRCRKHSGCGAFGPLLHDAWMFL